MQYILGEWEFYGLPVKVGEGVLIPRQDTETLVETVIRKNRTESPVIIDLCSGSGCIALALERELKASEVYAVEKSESAADYLRRNIALNSSNVKLTAGDCLENALIESLPKADIIVCNPPYLTAQDMKELQREVTFEPESALFGGEDGLIFYRSIAARWKASLRPGGWLICEFGMGQHTDIENILASEGFVNIQLKRDAAGIIRAAQAQKMEE